MPRWKNMLNTSDEIFRLKRLAVLREANRIIGRRGYHNTSLDDIADALGVSKGTLYNYVHDKQEILFECHMMGLEVGDRAIDFAVANGRTSFDKLRLMLRAFVAWMNGPAGASGVMTEVSALRPEDRKVVVKRRDESQARLVSLVEAGIADGSVRPLDARLTVYTLMGAVNSVALWYSPRGRLSSTDIADAVADVLTGGLAVPGVERQADLPLPAAGGDEPAATEERQGRRPAKRPARTAAAARSTPTKRGANG